MLTEIHVIVSFAIALVSCLLYIAVRRKRKSRVVWGFMAIPCLEFIFLYAWFYYKDIPIEQRAYPARVLLIGMALQISAIALSLAYRDWKHGR